MIHITHDFDGEWTVWNTETELYIEIFRQVKTTQHGRTRTVYNIVRNGQPVFEGVKHFQSARSLAIRQIK